MDKTTNRLIVGASRQITYPSLIGVTSLYIENNSSFSLPASQQGDLYVIVSGASFTTPIAPSGFTMRYSNTLGARFGVFTKVAIGDETSVTINNENGTGMSLVCMLFRNASWASNSAATNVTLGTSITTASMTAPTNGTRIAAIAIIAPNGISTAPTAPLIESIYNAVSVHCYGGEQFTQGVSIPGQSLTIVGTGQQMHGINIFLSGT